MGEFSAAGPRRKQGFLSVTMVNGVGIYGSIKGEDCVTALCGRKISLYTGRLSGQRTEDYPPGRCSGTQSCPDASSSPDATSGLSCPDASSSPDAALF